MDPIYQVYALPGTKTPQYTMTDAYVAATSNQASQQAITGAAIPEAGSTRVTGYPADDRSAQQSPRRGP